jgi:hypothetical protein
MNQLVSPAAAHSQKLPNALSPSWPVPPVHASPDSPPLSQLTFLSSNSLKDAYHRSKQYAKEDLTSRTSISPERKSIHVESPAKLEVTSGGIIKTENIKTCFVESVGSSERIKQD